MREDKEGRTRIIGTYDVAAGKIREILKTYWPILTDDVLVRDFVEDHPSVVYRKGHSLQDRLVRSHYVAPRQRGTWLERQTTGSFKCGSCKACSYMPTMKAFSCPVTGITYQIRDFCNCKSKGVVYLAQCTCSMLYVGKTVRELRRRILEHIWDILHSRGTAIAKHMRQLHSEKPYDIKFCAIELIKPNQRRRDLDKLLLQKETAWIYRLKTVDPCGLNETLSFTSFI